MSHFKSLTVMGALWLVIFSLTALRASEPLTGTPAPAAQSDGAQVMQALLSEVHELRLALQRSNLNAYHAQITIERMRIERQQVDRLSARLDEVRIQTAKIKVKQAELQDGLKWVERKLPE